MTALSAFFQSTYFQFHGSIAELWLPKASHHMSRTFALCVDGGLYSEFGQGHVVSRLMETVQSIIFSHREY